MNRVLLFHVHTTLQCSVQQLLLIVPSLTICILSSHPRGRCSRSDALVTCSALTRLYRQILLYGAKALDSSSGPDHNSLPPAPPDVFFLFLHGDYDLIQQRMVARRGHYMKADLLRSQFDVLEPPSDEENVLPLAISRSVTDMAVEVQTHIVRLNSST